MVTPAIEVDFAALERMPRPADLRLLWRREVAHGPTATSSAVGRFVVGILALLGLLGVAAALLLVDWRPVGMAVANVPDVRPFARIAGIVVLCGTIAAVVWWSVRIGRSARLSRWAAENGFAYRRRLADLRWTGTPFRPGRSVTTDVVWSDRPGLDVVVGRYRWRGELDRRNGSLQSFTFLQLTLPTEVPHLVLIGRGASVLAAQGLSFRGSQRLSLEGDFDRHFQLLVPQGYERDALYVFAPDLMARVIDVAPGTEIELVENHVDIYLPGHPRLWRADRMRAVLALAGALQAKLDRQTVRYRDDREGTRVGNVALAGQRLRGGIPLRSVVIGILTLVPSTAIAVWLILTFTGR